MKTTIDIPAETLADTVRITGATTKREAVVIALADFNRRHRLRQLAGQLGTFTDLVTPAELQLQRRSRP